MVLRKKIDRATAERVVSKKYSIPRDTKKRLFMKLLGIAGIGFVGSLLFPKKASAYSLGGTAAPGSVGVKNSAGTRIDPATESTVGSIKTATEATKTATDTINTNIGTLVTNSNKFTFSSGSLVTVTSGGSSVVGINDAQSNRINPATDDAIILLRRMVKLMESQATVDSANRQRISVDSWGLTAALLGTGTSASCPRVALGSDSTIGTVTSVTNVVTVGSYAAQQMYGDVAHDVYANALRRNLTFTSSV